ncbi:hypothetical protein [Methanocella arvoryzae]|uniref:Uncharacterized protein n=1 Tax=Methanocella arvoryzae (strain DSM 22066 / NBRC 105507 / MRE50) TaxID=351160 RepID=Q0W1I7_METAR|nr:hypothetical protein [Methanocella arvoryzae]CAJ37756.1 hypothetical protein RCIX2715 [Methanocella arvoryzae MRE50]
MMKKLFVLALVTLAALVFAGPAMAQYGMGAGLAAAGGAGPAGGVSYGAPQDCVATVSCNIPATQMVPYMTTTCDMQTVNYPVTVPKQTTVTVPRTVVVPEQVPVTTYETACAQAQVPVQVPAVAYQPVTTMIPQTKTFCLGNAPAGAGIGAACPSGPAAAGGSGVGLGAAAAGQSPGMMGAGAGAAGAPATAPVR